MPPEEKAMLEADLKAADDEPADQETYRKQRIPQILSTLNKYWGFLCEMKINEERFDAFYQGAPNLKDFKLLHNGFWDFLVGYTSHDAERNIPSEEKKHLLRKIKKTLKTNWPAFDELSNTQNEFYTAYTECRNGTKMTEVVNIFISYKEALVAPLFYKQIFGDVQHHNKGLYHIIETLNSGIVSQLETEHQRNGYRKAIFDLSMEQSKPLIDFLQENTSVLYFLFTNLNMIKTYGQAFNAFKERQKLTRKPEKQSLMFKKSTTQKKARTDLEEHQTQKRARKCSL